MPIIKSAKKRVRVAEKAAIRNSKTKRSLKTALKAFHAKATGETQAEAQSMLDTAVKKGLMHKNKAARQKAQLARVAKEAGVKTTAKKSAPKKATAPKAGASATAKKTTAAKKATTAKKAPASAAAKKPAAKK